MPAGKQGHNDCQLSSKVVLKKGLSSCRSPREKDNCSYQMYLSSCDVLVPSIEQPLTTIVGEPVSPP